MIAAASYGSHFSYNTTKGVKVEKKMVVPHSSGMGKLQTWLANHRFRPQIIENPFMKNAFELEYRSNDSSMTNLGEL